MDKYIFLKRILVSIISVVIFMVCLSISPHIIPVGVVLFLLVWVIAYMKEIGEALCLWKDRFREVQESKALLISKRYETHYDKVTITIYFVTFRIEGVGTVEMRVPEEFYLTATDWTHGELRFRGQRFVSFYKEDLD